MIVSCCAYLLTSVSMNLRPLNWGLYLNPALAAQPPRCNLSLVWIPEQLSAAAFFLGGMQRYALFRSCASFAAFLFPKRQNCPQTACWSACLAAAPRFSSKASAKINRALEFSKLMPVFFSRACRPAPLSRSGCKYRSGQGTVQGLFQKNTKNAIAPTQRDCPAGLCGFLCQLPI